MTITVLQGMKTNMSSLNKSNMRLALASEINKYLAITWARHVNETSINWHDVLCKASNLKMCSATK